MSRIHLLLLLLLAVVAVPFASADLITLNQNNLGVPGPIATVNLSNGTDGAFSGVWVTITAGAGYSLKLQGGDVLFNSSASLTSANIMSLTADGYTIGTDKFNGSSTRAGFTFNYDLANFNKGGLPNGYTSAHTIMFFISGVTTSQLEQGNPSWGVHFCVGADTNCGPRTGFATNGTGNVTVPEPGTLSMLGTGLLGIAGFARRRFFRWISNRENTDECGHRR